MNDLTPVTGTVLARLVDADGRTWDITSQSTAERPRYRTASEPGREPVTVQDIILRAGPVRPIIALTAADEHHLTTVLTRLARHCPAQLIPTVIAAIYDAQRIVGPTNPLSAGRPGSWESHIITAIAYSAGRPVIDGDPRGYDKLTLQTVADMIVAWVTGTTGYVEVACNLAGILGPVIDKAGGWSNVVPDGFDFDPHAEAIRKWATSRIDNPA